MTKTIYTFWENKDEMPDYIKMCIESWRKFLPDYKIVILNYENTDEYIGKNFYDKSLYENFSIAQQTQAIRAAILYKQGGIWLDADIILTNSNIEQLFDEKADFNIFENRIACIKAKKGSKIAKKWVKGIKWNILKYKYLFKFLFVHFPYQAADMMNWNYLSNIILDKLLRTKNKKTLNNVSITKSKTYPEISWDKECNKNKFAEVVVERYNNFYMKNNFAEYALQNNKGMIILHNSWMPRDYKTMPKEKVLAMNNTLSSIFKAVL